MKSTIFYQVLLSWWVSGEVWAFDDKKSSKEFENMRRQQEVWATDYIKSLKRFEDSHREDMRREHMEKILRMEKCDKDLRNLYPKANLTTIDSICNPFISDSDIERFYDPKFMACYTIFKEANFPYQFAHYQYFDHCNNREILEGSQKEGFANCLIILLNNKISNPERHCSDNEIRKGSQQFGYTRCLDFHQKAGDTMPLFYCSRKEILEASLTPQYPLCYNILKKEGHVVPSIACGQKQILEASQKAGFGHCLKALKNAGALLPESDCQKDQVIEASHKPEFILCLAAQKEHYGSSLDICLKDDEFKKIRLNGQEEIRQRGDYNPDLLDPASRPIKMDAKAVPEKEVEDSTRASEHKKRPSSPQVKSPASKKK